MEAGALIVEELYENGTLRVLKMFGEENGIIIAQADELDEEREGPFYFFDPQQRQEFREESARCQVVNLSASKFWSDGSHYLMKLK